MSVLHSAPRFASNAGVLDALETSLSVWLEGAVEQHGEIVLTAKRNDVATVLQSLRDDHQYQQLMEIAGADYPDRAERFEVVYMLLSLTKNHRILVKCATDEATPVPTATTLWPNAGWLEREVFDMYGVVFDGNTDLRRILTDYGFEGHPFRKDFPMTGYTELRYSEDEKRVVYEPVELPQDMRSFDFLSPWEGSDYVLPGDEKADGAPTVDKPKVTEKPGDSGADQDTNEEAAEKSDAVPPDMIEVDVTDEEIAPDPTEDRPARAPAKGKARKTKAATKPAKKSGEDDK